MSTPHTIAAARAELVAILAPAAPGRVGGTFPAPLSLPCVVIGHGSPWIEPLTFGESAVSWSILLVVRPGAGPTMLGSLDAMTQHALELLAAADLPGTAEAPEIITVDGQQASALACRITTTTTITL